MNRAYVFNKEETDPQNYYWFKGGLNEQSLEKLFKDLESLPYTDAKVIGDGDKPDRSIRSSRVKWIPQTEEWSWLYDILMNLADEANKNVWKFDLQAATESIQYTEYLASEEGHYAWHQDIGPGNPSLRKVSLTIQLSEGDSYEGGDLQIWKGGEVIDNTQRGKGVVVIFPSYMMHRVSQVTKGIRKSLVLWVGGEHYK
jgi:PKHD-type hydroxylase